MVKDNFISLDYYRKFYNYMLSEILKSAGRYYTCHRKDDING